MSAADRTPAGSEWLVTDAARLALRVRARREVAVADLFLPADGRLRDDDRATIASMLGAVVEAVERSLRVRLATALADRPMLAETLASGRIPIAWPALQRAGALRDPELVAILARRAEEGRMIARLRMARDRALELDAAAAIDPLDGLARDGDPAIAAAAALYAAAGQSGRHPFGGAVPAAAELPAEVQHRLVWRIAAALRGYIVASQAVQPAAIDPLIAQAADRTLAGYDDGATLAALGLSLARALLAAARLDDALIAGALAAGDASFAAAALAVRAGIGFDAAWDMMCDPDGGRLLLLCRAAGVEAAQAADLALRLANDEDDEALADRLDAYDGLSARNARRGARLVAARSGLSRIDRRVGTGWRSMSERMTPVRGLVDRDGRLIEADPELAALHLRAGGREGGVIAPPQLASLVRLVRRIGIVVSRGVVVADEEGDLDLWVRAQPEEDGVRLAIAGWTHRIAPPPPDDSSLREQDFLRAGADWTWATDAALKLTSVVPPHPEAAIGDPLTRLFILLPGADGALPMLEAVALHRRFDDQPAGMAGGATTVRLSGMPLIDGLGRFAGYHGGAVIAPIPSTATADEVDADAFGERLDAALRGPLDRIVANAETIRGQSDGPLRRDYATYAADIATAGRHLLALVGDLVDLQAIERPDFKVTPEPIDLADVARRAAGLLGVRAADRAIRIDRPGDHETAPVSGDFRRVLQILVNLIGNAVRYSPEGGMLWVRCEPGGSTASVVVGGSGQGAGGRGSGTHLREVRAGRIHPSRAAPGWGSTSRGGWRGRWAAISRWTARPGRVRGLC